MTSGLIPYLLAVYPTVLFLYLFIWHPNSVAQKIGHSAKAWDLSPKSKDKLDKWLFTLTHYGILGVTWIQALIGSVYDNVGLQFYFGALLAVLGGLLCIKAQLDMSNSWRMGVIASKDIPLITDGLFRLSRNPFYVGLLLVFWGIAIAISSVVIIAISIAQTVLIHRQVLKEEKALSSSLGEGYENYKKATRRYF